MVIDEKLSFLRKITNTTKALKQKEIDRLTSENAALTAKIETLQTLIQNQNMKGARHNGKIYV